MASASFRFVNDIMRALDVIEDDLSVLTKRMQAQRDILRLPEAAALFTIDQRDGQKNSPAAPDANKVKLDQKSLKAVRESLSVLPGLKATLEAIDVLIARLKTSFPDSGDTRSTMQALMKTRKRALDEMAAAYKLNQQLATVNVPDGFGKFANSVQEMLAKGIAYDEVGTFLYLFERPDQSLAFSYYIDMRSVTDETGELFPHLLVILSHDPTLGKTWLNTATTFQPPDETNLVHEVTNLRSAARGLRTLLDIDSFASSFGTVPFEFLQQPKRELFSASAFISSVRLDEDTGAFTFFLKPTVKDRNQVQTIAGQLGKDLDGLTRKLQVTRRMSIVKRNNQWTISFSQNLADARRAATEDDLAFFADRFGLPPQAITNMLRIINGQRR